MDPGILAQIPYSSATPKDITSGAAVCELHLGPVTPVSPYINLFNRSGSDRVHVVLGIAGQDSYSGTTGQGHCGHVTSVRHT